MKKEEMHNNNHKGIKPSVFITTLVIVALLSVFVTLIYVNARETDNETGIETDSTSEELQNNSSGTTIDEMSLFTEAFHLLQSQYYEEIDSDVLIEGAISGMAEAVEDPYTEYLDEVESSTLNEDITGSFEGIGAEVMKEGEGVKIVSPIADSPAEKAGLLPNDIILAVDGESVAELTLTEAVSLIRGPKGTNVILSVKRGDQLFELTVTRDSIPLETIKYNLDETDSEIGYIQITNFSMPTYDELVNAVEELRSQGAQSFIFDVRGNPGGLLNIAIQITNIFVPEGETLLRVEQRGEEPIVYTANDTLYGDFKVTEPSVLLIDGGSASASEILAGAMNESADIPLIGLPTFGKGTIQSIYTIEDTSELKLTVGRWLTPEGNWVNEEGIQPTTKVELPEYVNLLIIDTSQTYSQGNISDEVENLEAILSALSYDPGEVDGIYDQETVRAVEEFQSDNNLEVNGEVQSETATAMVEQLRNKIEENDTQYDAAKELLQTIK